MKKPKKNFIAYRGEELTIEWYFDGKDRSQALEYYEELSKIQKGKLDYLFRIPGDTGKIRSKEKFRNEDDQIYAFKPQPDRFLCFFYQGGKVIITNAFEKKQDRLPAREKQKALKAQEDYIKRSLGKNYYE